MFRFMACRPCKICITIGLFLSLLHRVMRRVSSSVKACVPNTEFGNVGSRKAWNSSIGVASVMAAFLGRSFFAAAQRSSNGFTGPGPGNWESRSKKYERWRARCFLDNASKMFESMETR